MDGWIIGLLKNEHRTLNIELPTSNKTKRWLLLIKHLEMLKPEDYVQKLLDETEELIKIFNVDENSSTRGSLTPRIWMR